MSKKIQQLFSLVFLTGLLFMASSSHAKLPFENVVIFGDSLSDNGNLFNGNVPWWLPIPKYFVPKKPYFEGRFSNGFVWSDKFADFVLKSGIKTLNYAVGGSVLNKHVGYYMPYSFANAIDRYQEIEQPNATDMANTLFIIWIGANDYLQGIRFFSTAEKDTDFAIATFKTQVQELINKNAKHFLFVNLPDISRIPYTDTEKKKKELAVLISMHNVKLQSTIDAFKKKYPEIKMENFEANIMFNQLMDDPIAFNEIYHTNLAITNPNTPCWMGGYTVHADTDENTLREIEDNLRAHAENKFLSEAEITQAAQMILSSPSLFEAYNVSQQQRLGTGLQCENPDNYIFWDHVHATTVIHQVMAKVIIEKVYLNW